MASHQTCWVARMTLAAFVVATGVGVALAQEGRQGRRRGDGPPPGAMPAMPQAMPVQAEATPSPGGEPPQPPKPDDKPKGEEGPKPVQRPLKPTTPPNPEELKVEPDAEGKLRFSFNGQPWPAVLEWLAQKSKMSLDWQELPPDYLNLTTQRPYTIEETRDLINRHLLARGFTLLCQGDVLTVANIKKLDPSLVPRVAPDDLEKRDPHEFVKVSFPLGTLVAETAVEEFNKTMLSPNGTLKPLMETNRIEAMDAVANLREIYAVLKSEQAANNQGRLREFHLQHARASEVREQLLALLGIESRSGGGPQQNQQPGGPPVPMGPPSGGQLGKKKSETTIAVNERMNSLLVNASPDKMAMIAQAISVIDVPADRNQTLLSNMNAMQTYRLVGVDPEPVVKTLREMGNLEPTTRLDIDAKNKTIIAYASLADHVTIRTVIAKLSGSERSFEVRALRRLPADYVAGTIESMMNGPKKKEQRSSPWDWRPRETPQEPTNQFRIDADIELNRLILYANEIELAEVDKLLVKLGEIPAKGSGDNAKRVIEGGDAEETEELIERLRQIWPTLSPNPLVLPEPAPAKQPAPTTPENSPPPVVPKATKDIPERMPKTTAVESLDDVFRLTEMRRDAAADENAVADGNAGQPNSEGQRPEIAQPAESKAATQPVKPAEGKPLPPVTVSIGPDGNLVISSDDPEALSLLEDTARQMATHRKEYKVYHLKYALAYNVAYNLEEFFKEEKKENSGFSRWYFGFDSQDESDSKERRLSKRKKLKFVSDTDSNTIIVEGGDAEQLKTVEDLVKLYDQAPPKDSQSDRKTQVFRLQNAKASTVSDAIKEVYRDLLSANDKALMGGNQQREQPRRDWFFGPSSDEKGEQKVPRFKGLLSIGVDDASNTLVLSAPAFLFEPVSKMIAELDRAAAPETTVRVVKVGEGISAERLQDVLESVLGAGAASHSKVKATTTPQRDPSRQGRRSQNRSGQGQQSDGGHGTGGNSQ